MRASPTYLFDLEPELDADGAMAQKAFLVEALFGRQVALSESNLFDNVIVRSFFRDNKLALLNMVENEQETPLLGTLGRGGSDLRQSLAEFLKPQGEKREPPYFSSLSPETNGRLRESYDPSMSSEGRVEWFVGTAGARYADYFATALAYFDRAGPRAIVAKPSGYNVGFYEQAKCELTKLRDVHASSWSRLDHDLFERLIRTLESEPSQRRQQLHNAIFADYDEPVRYYQGRPHYMGLPLGESTDNFRRLESWRFMINTIWNSNFASQLVGSFAIYQSWPRTDLDLLLPVPQTPFADEAGAETIEFPIECAVYYDAIDLGYVRKVREFCRNRNSTTVKEILENAGEVMAKRLTDSGLGKDVTPTRTQEFWRAHRASLGTGAPVLLAVSLGWLLGYIERGTLMQCGAAITGVLKSESWLKRWLRFPNAKPPQFKRFFLHLEKLGEKRKSD